VIHDPRFTDLLGPPDDGPIPVPVDQGPLPVPVDEALPLVPNNEGEVDGRAFGADLVGAFDHHTGEFGPFGFYANYYDKK